MSQIFDNAQWLYVAGAYAVTIGGLLGLAWLSYRAMRAAERRVDGMKDKS